MPNWIEEHSHFENLPEWAVNWDEKKWKHRASSYVWRADKVELPHCVALEYKVKTFQENTDCESCQTNKQVQLHLNDTLQCACLGNDVCVSQNLCLGCTHTNTDKPEFWKVSTSEGVALKLPFCDLKLCLCGDGTTLRRQKYPRTCGWALRLVHSVDKQQIMRWRNES